MKNFTLTFTSNKSNNGWFNPIELTNREDLYSVEKRIFLFMIGGSGASIMQPFLSIFTNCFSDTNIRLIPIFIDRNFNSTQVSHGIESIEQYRLFCQYSAREKLVSPPYFFLDDDALFRESNQLDKILHKIQSTDLVSFSYSIYNQKNINLKIKLTQKILSFVNCAISNQIFLPYFKVDKSDDVDEDFTHPINLVKENLKQISANLKPEENAFYVGVPDCSNFKFTAFQRNPFHIVSLIQAYGLFYDSVNPIKQTRNQKFFFSISDSVLKSKSLEDLIPNSNLREIVVKNDFRELIWNQLINESFFSKYQVSVDEEMLEILSNFLKESTCLIEQLGDCTIHPTIQIYLRRKDKYNYDTFWEYLKHPLLGVFRTRYSKTAFLKDIQDLVEVKNITTGNMAIHEVLVAINRFIDIHWKEISVLYF